MSERETGIVKWFSAGKGYGFIKRDWGEDVLVRWEEITRSEGGFPKLEEGQRVEFTVEDAPGGPRAVDVVVLPE
ncbi:MAG: cold-shock protein [Chloroflexi bacterium]|nr:cold-shock protein [Chloroflexota bacterium]MBU1747256.1 cold-shock protein [Chloroflexota bacterium]MBU1879016.1 cold-shock protein [Chloroflexota bacterium]